MQALQLLVLERLDACATKDSPLFVSAKGGNRLGICDLGRMWKTWVTKAGIKGSFASHTARKTFGDINRVERKAPLEVLQKAYGHASGSTTPAYLCIQDDELKALYEAEF